MKQIITILAFILSPTLLSLHAQQVTMKVSTPGTLSSMIAESKKYTITNMKVVGAINASDINLLREMAGRRYVNSSITTGHGDIGYDVTGQDYEFFLGSETEGSLAELDLSEATFVGGVNDTGPGGYINYARQTGPHSYYEGKMQCEPGVVNYAMFAGCTKLRKLTLPAGISEIRSFAFWGCSSLEDIIFPGDNYVKTLGFQILYNTKVATFHISRYVEDVTYNAFDGAVALTDITVDADNTNYRSIDGAVYSADGTHLVICPAAKDGTFAIADGTITLDSYSMGGCSDLTAIIIPPTVTTLKDYVFYTWEYSKYKLNRLCQPAAIYLSSDTPPSCTERTFYDFNQQSAQTHLYVPRDCKGNYEYATGWGDFMVIEEFSVSPCAAPTIEYKDGKLTFGCDTENAEFYYTIRFDDSRLDQKATAGITLSGDFTVEVYAIAPGFDRSETVTASFSLNSSSEQPIVPTDDVNQDGVVDSQDVLHIYHYMQTH